MPDVLIGSESHTASVSSTATKQAVDYNALTTMQASKPAGAVQGDYQYWGRGDASSGCPGTLTDRRDYGPWSAKFTL